jgi:hypothetical protein
MSIIFDSSPPPSPLNWLSHRRIWAGAGVSTRVEDWCCPYTGGSSALSYNGKASKSGPALNRVSSAVPACISASARANLSAKSQSTQAHDIPICSCCNLARRSLALVSLINVAFASRIFWAWRAVWQHLKVASANPTKTRQTTPTSPPSVKLPVICIQGFFFWRLLFMLFIYRSVILWWMDRYLLCQGAECAQCLIWFKNRTCRDDYCSVWAAEMRLCPDWAYFGISDG